jgi:hypothetical protein
MGKFYFIFKSRFSLKLVHFQSPLFEGQIVGFADGLGYFEYLPVVHVLLQGLGQMDDVVVRVPVVLDNAREHPRHSTSRPIESVNETLVAGRILPVPNVQPPALEVHAIRSARYFTVALVCRLPGFDVVLAVGRRSQFLARHIQHSCENRISEAACGHGSEAPLT